jgi:hypothetical protein
MPGLLPTGSPLMYIVPTVPDLVIATCVHWLLGSGVGTVRLICCSPPPPFTVMENLGELAAPPGPDLTARNMYTCCPVPRSKIRCRSRWAAGLTQVAIVKSCRPATTPAGSATYWFGSVPFSRRALPKPPWPGIRVAGAGCGLPTSTNRPASVGPVVWTIWPVKSPYHSNSQ